MFEELEYKYRADNVKLSDFNQLIGSLRVLKHVTVASWDIYYGQDGSENSFQRLRLGPEPELTKKVKTVDGNNWIRLESDLPLDPAKISEEKVAFHVGLDGYRENFRIFKYCDIHVLEFLNYSYYVVCNCNLNEIGRFIEVEVNKDKVSQLNWEPGTSALYELRWGEELLEKIGITAQNRLKKSLFELYRKPKEKA